MRHKSLASLRPLCYFLCMDLFSTREILTVTELTRQVQDILEATFDQLWVEGEISNLRRPASGHLYFTLKDEESQVRAVLFRPAARALRFALEDGMHIVCRARMNVYRPRGEYQLIVDYAEPKGAGALQIAFEQLKAKLQAEGLFDPARKKPIPYLPSRIGVVTSPSGAVIRDILNITKRRFPSVGILIAPVRVQGAEAPAEIVEALHHLNEIPGIDVIIVARGGGSLEDLMAFNNEGVARAIFASRVPVVSAVGHEIDFTIADFVADMRAPTPSAAAELVVPMRSDLAQQIRTLTARLTSGAERLLKLRKDRLETLAERVRDPRRRLVDLRLGLDERFNSLSASLVRRARMERDRLRHFETHLQYLNPGVKLATLTFVLDNMRKSMITGIFRQVEALRTRLAGRTALLDSLSPLGVLARGYAIARTIPEGRVIRDAKDLSTGDPVGINVAKGRFDAVVTKIEEE
ncbi:MAG TPA: exodeoxyribonuclease VII large subunit [Syntrophales bacterium]|nr:exodeoxyribonuclease VII large subunit [Syntrophales bacterium]